MVNILWHYAETAWRWLCAEKPDREERIPSIKDSIEDAEAWWRQGSELAYATADLPGVPGTVKRDCEHFLIEEMLGVTNDGVQYWWFKARRRGSTTSAARRLVAARLKLSESDVGVASTYPARAVVSQWFSVPARDLNRTDLEQQLSPELDVVEVRRGSSPMGLCGFVAATRFEVVISGCDANETTHAVARRLAETGVPNYLDVNLNKALLGRGHVLRFQSSDVDLNSQTKVAIDAFAALIFNVWLSRRIQRDQFETRVDGDLCWGLDYTGPVLGRPERRRPRKGTAARAYEDDVATFVDFPVVADYVESRRVGRIIPHNIVVDPHADGFVVKFILPPGSCPSAVIREFIKDDPPTRRRGSNAPPSPPTKRRNRPDSPPSRSESPHGRKVVFKLPSTHSQTSYEEARENMSEAFKSIIKDHSADFVEETKDSRKIAPTHSERLCRHVIHQLQRPTFDGDDTTLRTSKGRKYRACSSVLNRMRAAATGQGRTAESIHGHLGRTYLV